MSSTSIDREVNEIGIACISHDWKSHREYHVSLKPVPGEPATAMVPRLARLLRRKGAFIVTHEIFGSLALRAEILHCMEREFGTVDWPVTWVDGAGANGGLCGIHVFAVAGVNVDDICIDGRIVGRSYDDGHNRHCHLGDLRPEHTTVSAPAQSRQTFDLMERALQAAGMALTDLVRTWFFLDDILSWYGGFNAVRSAFFRERGQFRDLIPASTGVGGKNASGAALVARAWAVRSRGASSAEAVPSPLQCPSLNYGSAFSRAVIVNGADCRRLTVSGTASIEPDGASAHIGDVESQVSLTMDVVRAIFDSRGFDFADITRATAYFKDIADAPVFERWLKQHDRQVAPFIVAQDDICRSELLFEIELDAVKAIV